MTANLNGLSAECSKSYCKKAFCLLIRQRINKRIKILPNLRPCALTGNGEGFSFYIIEGLYLIRLRKGCKFILSGCCFGKLVYSVIAVQ